ncbi:Retrovirus-related Pol polyprotein from transposon 17.6 [Thelohanellus kitauei]|uniref:Retrovirus-related Pol polyprotein from transposon 17.6 n=1 Tax=Thelohanellus kitauei TaxID=669202 RepID=A0A0C2IF12_THEKT|nr:Retrovirus-related Pol polyprotein from transposon 17.6 [Thelohanellus kitauei]KII71300.1 Retrovirus-related Pol polyprotein from transposon 17.6 [Thelohanellus kitauei]
MRPDTTKVDAIKNIPMPGNIEEVQSFLDMVSDYRRNMKNFSEIAKPHYTCGNYLREFIWTGEQDTSFSQSIKALMTEPILGYPHITKTYQVFSDASKVGIGGTLEQNGTVID